MTRLYDDALTGVGLNVAQYSLLRHLQRLQQPCITELADAVGLERSTLGRNLRVLEGKGLVQMGGGTDQRNRLVLLSEKGEQALAEAQDAWQRVQTRLKQHLQPQHREALGELLEALEALQ